MEFECPGCLEDYDPCSDQVVSIESCGHSMCKICYGFYLDQKLSEGPICIKATCSDEKCKMILPDSIYKSVLSPDKYKRY